MHFDSYLFILVFLPLAFIAYLITRKTFAASLTLVAASAVFYGYVTYWYFFPMIVSALVDYRVGIVMHRESRQSVRKLLLTVSIILNIGLLCFFKYTTWLTTGISDISAAWFGIALVPVFVPLPPGISFYTFQTMSYTIDIYRRQFEPTKKFWDYFAFVTFFPQLVAGPIERAKDLLPQLSRVRPIVEPEVASLAVLMIVWGLTLKLVFADNFGGVVEFLEINHLSNDRFEMSMGWAYGYAFAFQIYCDFFAYTIIARGAAKLFGVELSPNFLTPYFSASPSEFWQRWHVSLSSWIRDYVYIPMGGNRAGRFVTLRNLIITMFVAGLWHGAGILFVVWGLFHGLLLVIYNLFPIDEKLSSRFGRIGKFLAIVLFFHLTVVGWIFFRAPVDDIRTIFYSMLLPPFTVSNAEWIFKTLSIYAVPIIILDLLCYQRHRDVAAWVMTKSWYVRMTFFISCIYALGFFGARQEHEFIYFQF